MLAPEPPTWFVLSTLTVFVVMLVALWSVHQ
jgi:hypothetical protein